MSDTDRAPPIRIARGLAWSGLAIAAMLAASWYAWMQLPADAQLPIHWNIAGEVDGYAPKATALLFAPAVAVLITAIFAVVPLFEPRRENLNRGRTLYHALWAGMLIIFAAVHAHIVTAALGLTPEKPSFLIPAFGILLVIIGNFLGKTRSNFVMGVRTPWTLSSDYAWEKTHRWLGRMWVMLGLATAASPFVLDFQGQMILFVGGALVTALAAVVMSYVYWRNDRARGAGGA
jgi:uncharacterized membrane protein